VWEADKLTTAITAQSIIKKCLFKNKNDDLSFLDLDLSSTVESSEAILNHFFPAMLFLMKISMQVR